MCNHIVDQNEVFLQCKHFVQSVIMCDVSNTPDNREIVIMNLRCGCTQTYFHSQQSAFIKTLYDVPSHHTYEEAKQGHKEMVKRVAEANNGMEATPEGREEIQK